MASKSLANRPDGASNVVAVDESYSPFQSSQLVRVVNDFEDDLLTGRLNGRATGFTGGYTGNISSTYTMVMPPYSGWNGQVPLPNPSTGTGASQIKIASSSPQDAAGGTGVKNIVIFYLDMQRVPKLEFVTLTGTTPVVLAMTNVYHFQYAFPVEAGSAYDITGNPITSNIGALWLGIGTTFSTTTGFSTVNYMWNRAGDGFMSSSVYVVPKGKIASLWSVKLNSDVAVSCSFKTYSRPSRVGAWSLNAEDNVVTGIVIRRSLAGGFLGAGAEFTVTAAKTVNSGTIACNFVMACYEFSNSIYVAGVDV